jgi:hypothetical protein
MNYAYVMMMRRKAGSGVYHYAYSLLEVILKILWGEQGREGLLLWEEVVVVHWCLLYFIIVYLLSLETDERIVFVIINIE